MTATRVFLVLFSLFLYALSIAGQLCTPETAGASGVLGNAGFTTAGTITGVQGVYIEKASGSTGYGSLFVVSSGLHAVFRFSSATAFTNNQAATATYGTSGTSGVTGTAFNAPTYITSDANGVCYLSDTGNKRIAMINACYTSTTATGAFGDGVTSITTAGLANTAGGISNPQGISTDSTVAGGIVAANPLFIAMGTGFTGSNGIIRFTSTLITSGTAFVNTATVGNQGTTVFGTVQAACTAGQLCDPRGIRYYNGPNVLFVANFGTTTGTTNQVIRLNTASGTATSVLLGGGTTCSSTDINAPKGVAYDTVNSVLYVADSGNNRITYFTAPTLTGAAATGLFFPSSATFSCPSAAVSQNTVNPSDVDIVASTQSPSGLASVVVSDLTNTRVLRICSATSSASFSVTISTGVSVSPSASVGGVSTSITTTGGSSGISTSTSVSSGSGVSVSNSQAAATVAISTSPTNSITVSLTASYSLSLTVSITTSLTTSITTSITTSVTNTNSNSQSITTSVTNSVSAGASPSITGSYSITVSNSYSITVSRSVRLCGNGKIDGLEKCDAGYGVNGKHYSCCSRRCKPKDGGKICKNKDVQCLGHGRCSDSGLCRGGKILVNKPCSTSGVSGVKNGRCNISANCVASST